MDTWIVVNKRSMGSAMARAVARLELPNVSLGASIAGRAAAPSGHRTSSDHHHCGQPSTAGHHRRREEVRERYVSFAGNSHGR